MLRLPPTRLNAALPVLRDAVKRSQFAQKRKAWKGTNRGIGLSLFFHGSGFTGGGEVNPIVVPLDRTTGDFSYTRRATSAASGLSYSIWTSNDLGIWTKDSGAVQGTPVVTGEVETVRVTISPALLANSKLFIQVRAE